MFKMDLGTHRGICLNGTLTPHQEKIWPWYIDHHNPPPNPEVNSSNIKFLALYFPQWYPAPENGDVDDWRYFHNPNFTINRHHNIMTRPLNNIYYDPRCFEQRRTQAALAKKYLLDGFIYYFYFTDNEWLLSAVNQRMLLDGEPNTDFAFHFVNENFGEREQLYNSVEELADTLMPYVTHPRYITVNGRPLFYIYIGTHLPANYIHELQDLLMEMGAQKLYIVASIQEYMGQTVKVEYADAYAEFPPNIGTHNWKSHNYTSWKHTDDHYHLGIALNFDNTPRLLGGDPKKLPSSLSKKPLVPDSQPTPMEFQNRCIARVNSWYPRTKGEKVVTFFAWNEWSEQASLEPSDFHGYEYLEALRNCRLEASHLVTI